MRTNLKEKVALVTGASSGLGARFARVLAANGALTVLASRRVERLKDLRAEIESAGGAAHVVQLDVTQPDSIRDAIEHTERAIGPVDILVNNSGVSHHAAPDRSDAGRLRPRLRYQCEGRIFCRAAGGGAHDRAGEEHARVQRPHRQYRVGGRNARAAANWPVLHVARRP